MPDPRTGGTDWFAWFIAVGFISIVVLAITNGIKTGDFHDVVVMLIGAMVGNYNTVINFRYGSTATSEKKTDTIATMASAATTTAATAGAIQAATDTKEPVSVTIEPKPGEPIPVVVEEPENP